MKSAMVKVLDTKQKQLGRVHMFKITAKNMDTGAIMLFIDDNKERFSIWGNEESYRYVDRIEYEPVEGQEVTLNRVHDVIF